MPVELVWLLPAIFLGALLYTSVGHGGATVYLAILTLAGYAVGDLVTTVLCLNILAAGVAFLMFQQAGHLRPRLLLPFALTSVPMAYVGGLLPLSERWQALVLGLALLAGSLRLLVFATPPRIRFFRTDHPAFYAFAPTLGAVLGFLAGATGIGGGIFLSPILLAVGWANIREAASVAGAFIVLNSAAGLAAKVQAVPVDVGLLVPMAAVILVGAAIGSFTGARKLPPRALQVLLGLVLLVAGVKAML